MLIVEVVVVEINSAPIFSFLLKGLIPEESSGQFQISFGLVLAATKLFPS